MATTPNFALRYPVSTDTADVPRDIGNLANDVDAQLLKAQIVTSGSPAANQVAVWNGTAWAYSAVTTAMINDGAVTTAKLAGGVAVPAGAIFQFGGAAAPTGYLLCDGTAVGRSTYAALFAAIGTAYGTGDGSTTFNLPNLKGRIPTGLDAAQTEFNALGKTGGEKTHVLILSEMAAHQHGQPDHSHTMSHDHPLTMGAGPQGNTSLPTGGVGTAYDVGGSGAGAPVKFYTGDTAGVTGGPPATSAAGGGGGHNNLQPYLVFVFIIKT